ncbi:MAG TPA: hypothetical protein VN903_14325 [Polyangia bacterium]|nr:hypothetical protein [Polyangia bacterium]
MSGFNRFLAFFFVVIALCEHHFLHDMRETMYSMSLAIFWMLASLHEQRAARHV